MPVSRSLKRSQLKPSRFSLTVIASTLTVIFGLTMVGSAQGIASQRKEKRGHRKVESTLVRLEKEHEMGPLFSHRFAQDRKLKIDDQDRVTVYIHRDKDSAIDTESLKGLGVEVVKGTDSVIQVKVPVNMLSTVADRVEGVSFVRRPARRVPLVTSQGVSLIQAPHYFSSGDDGIGVKVAVIDIGFGGLASAKSAGELPDGVILRDCTIGAGCVSTTFASETEIHGTTVAEILHDMAPGAELHLIKIDTELDLVDAKNYCITNGIRVVNHSVGWYNVNFYNGACYNDNPVCTANDAYAHGILWVNAAGNDADLHYASTFSDLYGADSIHDQAPSLFAYAGDYVDIVLTWDAWPATNQDFDLYLVDSSFVTVDGSNSWQTGSEAPVEWISYYVPVTGTYYVQVERYLDTISSPRFDVFSSHPLTPAVPGGSVTSPADAANVLAVGAIDYMDWPAGPQEFWSSQGPTNGGLMKPEICGPDGVSTYTYTQKYGEDFWGTSASTPHVAGAAALILSRNLGYSVSELWTAVTRSAVDLGSAGRDNVYGYGRLSVPSTFLDVSYEYWAHDYVTSLYDSGITGGCSTAPLLFCPDAGITRGEMAVFMEASLDRTPTTPCAGTFSDVSAATVGETVCRYIEDFASAGITGGCGGGKFCPNDPVTRGQMAVFIEAALGATPGAACSGTFLDVNTALSGDLFCRYIEDFATRGITSGCGGGNFCPNSPVTRSQMAVFLVAAPTPLNP